MVEEVTVQQASEMLGIKPGTVRKAYRHRQITGRRLAARPGWSFLLLDRESVERYRRVHLGRRGAAPRTCAMCGKRQRKHDNADHEFAVSERLVGAAEGAGT